MIVLPLVVAVVALHLYAGSGRYVVTENAYVKANIVAVSADVSGRVVSVNVSDNQVVKPGARLFTIDPLPFRIAVAETDAQLAVIRRDFAQLRFDVREAQAEAAEARERQHFLSQQFERQKKLKQRGMGSEEAYDEALHELKVGAELLLKLDQRIARSLAALGGDPELPVEKHPRFRRAMAIREQASVDLARTVIIAPATGVISNMKLQVGEYVKEGNPVFSLIETSPVWVEANLKETELTNLVMGQSATIVVDAYPDYQWRAVVDSIAPATGAEFALLPPQNATGNWVKVVQRLPVLLRIEHSDGEPVLRAGMTVTASIDTEQVRGLPGFVPEAVSDWHLPGFVRRALALDKARR
ncbi:MAG: HlyD family efflux transporter periplasmic adaptor subunit [Gammaproteobacteria bacterium]|jgi:membrane fusion protein (multidrug efflux system)|nr:HlyD family efflux transporter periplasmic adaptor subunit [Gammaproteobacteria bacterium]NCF83792.1 HlyD family efflux transporter periplasmic adaptor subunit [Pseudomonadota bacterium]